MQPFFIWSISISSPCFQKILNNVFTCLFLSFSLLPSSTNFTITSNRTFVIGYTFPSCSLVDFDICLRTTVCKPVQISVNRLGTWLLCFYSIGIEIFTYDFLASWMTHGMTSWCNHLTINKQLYPELICLQTFWDRPICDPARGNLLCILLTCTKENNFTTSFSNSQTSVLYIFSSLYIHPNL